MSLTYSEIVDSLKAQFSMNKGNFIVPFIQGTPGGGKSACCREIIQFLKEKYHIADKRIVEFNASLRENVDILGLPSFSKDSTYTRWLPPEEFYYLRASQPVYKKDKTGEKKLVGHKDPYCILLLEELTDAQLNMQNPLCRVILDRYAGQLKLSENLFIIANGNRVQDNSGAYKMSTKLANRVRVLNFQENIDDWIRWAIKAGINKNIIAFLKIRPDLLCQFDSKRMINATPRSWESASYIPEGLTENQFFEHLAGNITPAIAQEYVCFLQTRASLPSYEDIIKDPENVEIPSDPSLMHALVCLLAYYCKEKDAEALVSFYSRITGDFKGVAVRLAISACPALQDTKAFRTFIVKNKDLFINE